MERIETNIYAIENVKDLNCKYRTYRVRGIPDSDDYNKNMQILVETLSSMTRSPCILFTKGQETLVAQPEGFQEPPESVKLVGAIAKIEKLPETYDLNFDSLTPTTTMLASRFLQFSLQKELGQNPTLWQPKAGYPFYSKHPDRRFKKLSREIDLFRGFAFRVVILQHGRIGVCVDARSKYVARRPLPTEISREEFNKKYRGLRCVYEYGNTWYEIKLEAYNDLDASQVTLPGDVPLFDEVHRKAGSHKSQSLLALPRDCSVLVYYTGQRQPRNVPSGLCRLTYGTDHPDIKPFHSLTIKPPPIRREEIQFIVDRYLRGLAFGSTKVILSKAPLTIERKKTEIPDLEFGNNKVLSVKGTPGSVSTSLRDLPSKKKELLYSRDAGLFVTKQLDRQYFIMPQSVYESFGGKFVECVKEEARRVFPADDRMEYSPIIVPYNDSVQPSVCNLAKEIMRAVDENDVTEGYGIAMIPHLPSRDKGKEDELANFLMRELRRREAYVSIIHTEVSTESYEYANADDGDKEWQIVNDSRQRGKFKGYLRNVVLNKILITNNIWPFVLKTPLNADLTIGIDVKNNMVGFTLIYKSGADIRFFSSESDQKEQLSKTHMSKKVYEMIKEEQKLLSKNIRKIVIHRQGILFPSEEAGILQALDRLAKEKLLPEDYQCTFVEIKTTSRIPLRLFKVITLPDRQRENTYNPTVGLYFPISEDDAFICTTGYPYRHKGTTKPLHVVRTKGEMALGHILQDLFSLCNLTWTKIDDCSRLPLSIKMNDIRLREIAGEYDVDALRFGEEE